MATLKLLATATLLPVLHCLNEFTQRISSDGAYIWESTTDFVPVQSTSYGNMTIGDIMYMEFDFVWNGRATDSGSENFFRIGATATSTSCQDVGFYPGLDIGSDGVLELDLSDSASCSTIYQLTAFGAISTSTSYHIEISFNATNLSVTVDSQTEHWSRSPNDDAFAGRVVPVWWMSDKFGSSNYNLGDGTFSNILIRSSDLPFSFQPESNRERDYIS